MTPGDAASVREVIEAWRGRGADRLDPLRFYFIDALARRVAVLEGEGQRILAEKLTRQVRSYAIGLEKMTASGGGTGPAEPASGVRAGLGELTDALARGRAESSPFPQLAALADFRRLWSKLRIESQLRQSLEQVPTEAGPLNSSSLVHRSLTLMGELAPEYARQFLSYVDTLSWMAQLDDGVSAVVQDSPRAVPAKKRARHRSG